MTATVTAADSEDSEAASEAQAAHHILRHGYEPASDLHLDDPVHVCHEDDMLAGRRCSIVKPQPQ